MRDAQQALTYRRWLKRNARKKMEKFLTFAEQCVIFGFCPKCGATIPHRIGEGRCTDCMEFLEEHEST